MTTVPLEVNESKIAKFIHIDGEDKNIELPINSLAFSICQVPVIYHLGNKNEVKIYFKNGNVENSSEFTIPNTTSESIFLRKGEVSHLEVHFTELN